jgi:nucleoside-diphosphate-sugar epimerase
VARAAAAVGEAISRVIRRPPLLPRGQLTYFLWQGHPDSSKAQRELGWTTTPLPDGVRKTLDAMGLLEAG